MKKTDVVRRDKEPLSPEDRLAQVMNNLNNLQAKINRQSDTGKQKALNWQIKSCLTGINRLQATITR